jgi:signal transduction histidine kinase
VDDVISEDWARAAALRAVDQPSTELAAQLHTYGNHFLAVSSAAFKTSVLGKPVAINPVVAEEVVSVGREAIANCFSRAETGNIEVEIIYDEKSLALRVRDDGKGMDPGTPRSGHAGHRGSVGMRERAASLGATLKIWTRREPGTEIELIVPASTAYEADSKAIKPKWTQRLINYLRTRESFMQRRPDDW